MFSSPVKASLTPQDQGQDIAQLINTLMGMMMRSSQARVAQAGAQSPTVIVIPIVIQMPVWPGAELGGIAPRPSGEYVNCALLSPRSRVQIPAGPPRECLSPVMGRDISREVSLPLMAISFRVGLLADMVGETSQGLLRSSDDINRSSKL